MKGQSRRHSFFEAILNVLSGMLIAFMISQLASIYEADIQKIWPAFKWSISPQSNMILTIVLTGVSMCRGYLWRRLFN